MPPKIGLILRCLSLFYFIFGVGFITYGIKVLLSSVLLLQTGHHGIFAITFFYKGLEAKIFTKQSRNPQECHVQILDLGSQYFQRYDLWKLGFFQAPEFNLNRSSWNFHYKVFYTKFLKLKFLRREAKILRNIFEKFQLLARNIFGDMICGS